MNHSESLEYNNVAALHGGLQDGVKSIKDGIFSTY